MDHSALAQRPIARIVPLLSKLKNLWYFYPEHSLAELVYEVVLSANLVESDLPAVSYSDIEDIAYPQIHYLHRSRNLEMGISVLNVKHQEKTLPPTPFQTAVLKKVEETWRLNHQMRLGQLLLVPSILAQLEVEDI